MPRGGSKIAAGEAFAEGRGTNRPKLGFEAQLFLTANKLRKNLEPSDYKHVVLGLIFLKHISNLFQTCSAALLADDTIAAERPDKYATKSVFCVPKEARWSFLEENARQPTIGQLIDDAMAAIEEMNPDLKGALPKDYNRPALDKLMLGELIAFISSIAVDEPRDNAKDIFGSVYEYFLGGYAGSEGRRGGEFYTPPSLVRLMVDMLEPLKGRVYDPCCGSGGIFVQSEKFVESHGGRVNDISIYGQESNHTTWRLAKMNLAVRGMRADLRWNNEGSLHNDEMKRLRFDYVLANPPFNISEWGGERLREDPRWTFGAPPIGNANFAWLQHIFWHLAANGVAAVVLANGSMTSTRLGEGAIRRAMVEADAVDCIVALPERLFYSTHASACLWILTQNKSSGRGLRDRRGEVLFVNACDLGSLSVGNRKELTDGDIAKIGWTYHAWRKGERFEDKPGFCKAATLEEIGAHGFALTPGRYVGVEKHEGDEAPFVRRFAELRAQLKRQFAHGRALEKLIAKEFATFEDG
jgi:type I restriction enzyme M protein